MYHKILVPLDSSSAAEQALQEACRLAKWTNASVYVLHIIDVSQLNWSGLIEAGEADLTQIIEEAGQDIVAKAQAQIRKYGVESHSRVLSSKGEKIADVLLREAQEAGCDLIVMGTHGFTGLMHLLMGSVAEGVVRHANIPVLLVRHASNKIL
mgnify:FL=1